jgi:glycerophosphoryl diester phosphodiesterase
VTPELVAEMHEKGILVNCWTVDDPVRGQELADMGVDYITSNILY